MCTIACAFVAARLLMLPVADGAFVTAAGATGSAASDTANPPTAFNASRPCTPTPGPAPQLRSWSSADEVSGTATVAKPAGVVSQDLLLAFSMSTDGNASNNASTPSGWTLMLSAGEFWGGTHLEVFRKVAGSSEPASYTFSGFGVFNDGVVVIADYSGVDNAAPVQTSAIQTFSFSDAVAPSLSITTAPATLVAGFAIASKSSASTPSGMTARASTTTGFPTAVIAVFDETRAATGATGTRTSPIFLGGSGIAVSLALNAATTPDPTVVLSWTASSDTYVTGYRLTRTGGGTVNVDIAGRTTTTASDTTTTATSAYTFQLVAVAGSWSSAAASTTVASC